jgi:hypothetical protein
MQSNPLHIPRPKDGDIIFAGRFRLVYEPSLELVNFGVVNLRLTRRHLWLSDELAVPLTSIFNLQIIERGIIYKRSALRIVYNNPIINAPETVAICKLDPLGLGFYRRKTVENLSEVIRALMANPEAATSIESESFQQASTATEVKPDGCEVCGAKPAFYVGHYFLISGIVVSYRSPVRRRMHCKRCLLKHGLPNYLVTALTGWCGIGIFKFPFALYHTSLNLKPVIGNGFYILFALPLLFVVSLIACFLLH